MELTFRAATPAERLYIARQSTQIEGQTGSIGHLRADMGEDGKGFFPKWTSHRENLDTEDFQQEFEEVLEALVGDEQYDGFLKSRDAMRDFCREHPESALDHGFFSFGFRADTAQYACLIQLHPYKAEETCLSTATAMTGWSGTWNRLKRVSGSSTRTIRSCSVSRTAGRSVFYGRAARPSTGPAAILMTAMWR